MMPGPIRSNEEDDTIRVCFEVVRRGIAFGALASEFCTSSWTLLIL